VGLLDGISSLASSGKLKEIVKKSRGERELCELLASLLGAEANTVVNGVEADLLLDSEACEVKLHPTRFYSGFDQALALKHVAGVKEVYVLHIVKAVNEKYMEGLRRLCGATGVKAVVYSEVSGLHAVGE
jgi:hypothetical protein